MFRYLPSKKVFFVATIAIVLLGWTIVYQSTAPQRKLSEEKTFLSSIAHADVSFPDTDGDGLYDWEEELYGTDISDPDTNNNGILDGEEYDTEKENLRIETSDSIYVAVKRLGEEFQNFKDPTESLSTEPISYDDFYYTSDVHIIESSIDTNSEYITEALLILSKNTLSLEEEPLDIIKHWLETYSQKDIDKLDKIVEANIETARALMDIRVPTNYVETHLQIANNLYMSALSLENIEATTLDPIGGFFAAANYANYQSKYIDGVFKLAELNANTNDD